MLHIHLFPLPLPKTIYYSHENHMHIRRFHTIFKLQNLPAFTFFHPKLFRQKATINASDSFNPFYSNLIKQGRRNLPPFTYIVVTSKESPYISLNGWQIPTAPSSSMISCLFPIKQYETGWPDGT